jgi:hypothetical protein
MLLAAAHGDNAIVFHAYSAALGDSSTLVHVISQPSARMKLIRRDLR